MSNHPEIINDIVLQIELHSVEGIRNCFEKGLSPNEIYKGQPLIYELISEYTRTPRFKDCVLAFVDHGLQFPDKPLLAVLMNDASALNDLINTDRTVLTSQYSLRCAYTPLNNVSLLDICAEFNHVACAEVLTAYGADVNATAGTDEYGFGGQTPIFHTVNQNSNQSAEMMQFLLQQNANLDITVKGLIWGKGYDWETFIPSVNPVSYAMMGLLPQIHRDEQIIAATVQQLLKHQYNINYTVPNIPNKYLLQ